MTCGVHFRWVQNIYIPSNERSHYNPTSTIPSPKYALMSKKNIIAYKYKTPLSYSHSPISSLYWLLWFSLINIATRQVFIQKRKRQTLLAMEKPNCNLRRINLAKYYQLGCENAILKRHQET
jgi:hypothetical protein